MVVLCVDLFLISTQKRADSQKRSQTVRGLHAESKISSDKPICLGSPQQSLQSGSAFDDRVEVMEITDFGVAPGR